MSAKFYHAALGIAKAARHDATKIADMRCTDEAGVVDRHCAEWQAAYDDARRIIVAQAMVLHEEALDITAQMEEARNRRKPAPCDTFMVTIRPAADADWPAFRDQAHKWARSKVWEERVYAFEQKGTSDDTLGVGFHVHIVGRSKLPKAQVLQRCHNAFQHFAAKAAIQVDFARTPHLAVQRYLLAHASDDGHKEITAEWDARWRARESLDAAYGDLDHPLFQAHDVVDPA